MHAWKILETAFLIVCCFQFHDQVCSTKTATQFKCSSSCALTTDASMLPHVSLIRRSRLECASSCSKFPWCLKYIFTHLRACLLFLSAAASCPADLAALSGEHISVCVKAAGTVAAPCRMIRKVVLENGVYRVDYESLLQMLVVGNDLKFRFSYTNWTHVTSSNSYFIPSGMSPPMWGTAPAYVTNVALSRVALILRTFTANATGVQEEQYNSQLPSTLAAPNLTQWIFQLRCGNNFGNRVKVFSTGGSTTALMAAVANGYGINFLILGSGIRYLTANAVIIDGQAVYAQAMYYETKKMKFVTVRTSGSHNLVTWDHINKIPYELEPVDPDHIWYSDPCWTQIATTPTSSATAFQQLRSAVLSGKNVRVRFIVDDQIIYTRPVYVGINSSDIISIHVTNLIRRTSLLNLGLVFTSTKVHYILATDGFLQEFAADFGSDVVHATDMSASVDWFTDKQNFSLVHVTDPFASANQTTLTRLKVKVSGGNEVKVRLYLDLNESHLFTCETLQISSDGSLVQCQVNGQLAVNYFGNTMAVSQTSTGGLLDCLVIGCPTITTVTYSPTVTSGCPQFLSINSNGLMTSTVACLEYDATFKNHTDRSVYVDWLAAD